MLQQVCFVQASTTSIQSLYKFMGPALASIIQLRIVRDSEELLKVENHAIEIEDDDHGRGCAKRIRTVN